MTPNTQPEEIDQCVSILASVNPKIPFIFQPLSDPIGINSQALARIEREFYPSAARRLSDVRVIPQMHKIWGVP